MEARKDKEKEKGRKERQRRERKKKERGQYSIVKNRERHEGEVRKPESDFRCFAIDVINSGRGRTDR